MLTATGKVVNTEISGSLFTEWKSGQGLGRNWKLNYFSIKKGFKKKEKMILKRVNCVKRYSVHQEPQDNRLGITVDLTEASLGAVFVYCRPTELEEKI